MTGFGDGTIEIAKSYGSNWIVEGQRLKTLDLEREMMLERIKETILKVAEKYGIEVDRIILFGSRARGDFKENSDWDILIITKRKVNYETRKNFLSEVRWKLVNMDIIPEILIADRETFERAKEFPGFVYYWALLEGVTV